MEAHYVGCRGVGVVGAVGSKSKGEKIAPAAPLQLPPQPAAASKGPRSLLSRFGSQAQAFFSPKKSRFGSSVAIHKLRESKWFRHDEQGILCAVLESGFIVEIKADPLALELDEGIVAPDYHCYGVAMWKKGKEKTKNAEQIEIYTLNEKSTRKRVYKTLLTSFWKKGTIIRINNVADKQEQANGEKDIRSKLDSVARSRYDRNWHNSLHFVHWCRYGETPEQARTRQVTWPIVIWNIV
ncbi:lethal (1) G0469 NlpC/P60 domain-containing protein isoform X2 [Arctopsyche grandis]|uniref:lethal (1) G0469 NlpC/P60 domain-containing protein isoform X2 n=1 Tax=Arctopsyche grandis TaxID=121162 RepID=UPI00406DA0A7